MTSKENKTVKKNSVKTDMKKHRRRKKSGKVWWTLPVILVCTVILISASALGILEIKNYNDFANTKSLLSGGTDAAGNDICFPGVKVEGIDVSGFTYEGLEQKWAAEIEKKYRNRFIGFYTKTTQDGRATGVVIAAAGSEEELTSLLGSDFDCENIQIITAEELGYRSDYKSVLAQAFDYGRTGSLENRRRQAEKARTVGVDFTVSRSLFSPDKLRGITNTVSAMFTREEADATLIGFDFESRKFLYTTSSPGYSINADQLYYDTEALIRSGYGTVTVEVTELEPSDTAVFDPEVLRLITNDIANEYTREAEGSHLVGYDYETGYFRYSAPEDGYYVDADELYTEAMDLLESGGTILNVTGHVVEPSGDEPLDTDTLRGITDDIAREYSSEPRDAYVSGFDFDNREFLYTEAQSGTYVDADSLYESALEQIENGSRHLTVEVQVTKPGTATNQITSSYGMITEAVTNASSSSKARLANIRLACEAINGTVVNPGETFSFNSTVGQRTKAAGYQIATVYNAGEVAEDVGGGICQVSTTLWNAAMKADCELVERNAHSRPVAYVDKGKDATVSWGVQDMKFKNTSDSPMYIVAYVNDKKRVIIQIYGKLFPDGKYITIEAKTISKIQPGEPVYVQNPELISGTEVVVSEERVGYKAIAYRVYHKADGTEIERVELCRSYYKEAAAKIAYN